VSQPNFCDEHSNMFTKLCSVCEYERKNPVCSNCNHRICVCGDVSIGISDPVTFRYNSSVEHLDMIAWNKKAKESNSRISKRFA